MPEANIRAILAASALALSLLPAAAVAGEAPNLTGTWIGHITGGARFGALNHDAAEKEPVFADRAREWTLQIDRQEGSGLIGTWSTTAKKERLAGVIRQDKVTVLFADEDNIFDARLLSANEMELCAQDAGESTIAVCYVMKRK